MKKLRFLFLLVLSIRAFSQTVTDYDNNSYSVITIGNQTWMQQDLRAIHYSNGDSIANINDSLQWINTRSDAYCWHGKDVNTGASYNGILYNWYAAADKRNVCPNGWHVPTNNEWRELELYLGMSLTSIDSVSFRGTNQGGKLKQIGTSNWLFPNTGAVNSSNFNAIASGARSYYDAQFYGVGVFSFYWSTSEITSDNAWYRSLKYNTAAIDAFYRYKWTGMSIRCIKDSTISNTIKFNPEKGISIYPNPTTSKIIIDYTGSQPIYLSVYNLIGEEVIQQIQISNPNEIDLSNLPSGTYILKMAIIDKIVIRKFIKE